MIIGDNREILDNFYMKVRARTEASLRACLQIASNVHADGVWPGYRIDPKLGLILYWTDSGVELQKFPEHQSPFEYIWGWLHGMSDEEFNAYAGNWLADMDVKHKRGFEIYTDEQWGYVDGQYQAICAIKPYWAWLGK